MVLIDHMKLYDQISVQVSYTNQKEIQIVRFKKTSNKGKEENTDAKAVRLN